MSAPFNVKYSVPGMSTLLKEIEGLKLNIRRNAIRRGTRVAGNILRNAARALAPVDAGNLKKSIRLRLKTYVKSATAVAIVGPAKDYKRVGKFGRPIKPVKYAHLQNPKFVYQALNQARSEINTAYVEAIKIYLEGKGISLEGGGND